MGFLLTILTIQGLPVVVDEIGWRAAMPLLALGPAGGVLAMAALRRVYAPNGSAGVSSARGTSIAVIGPIARRSELPGRRSPRPATGSRSGTASPKSL
jgi:hypothetical protein